MNKAEKIANFGDLFLKLCEDRKLKPDSELLKRLQRPNTVLDVSQLSLSNEMCHVLGLTLSFNETITKARFDDSMISSEGMKEIISGLESNHSIQKLNLKGCHIRGDSVEALAILLRNNKVLTSLCLEWNDLGLMESSFIVFCDGLRANKCLKHLDLRNNQLTHTSIKELTEALSSNTSLKSIDLKWNKIGLVGGRSLLNLLHQNKTLVTLDLTGSDVPCDTIRSIESVLLRNQELQLLSRNCKKKTHVLCKKYRTLESERKFQVIDLKEQLEHTEEHLKNEKRNNGLKFTKLQKVVEEKTEKFNQLYKKFTQLELDLNLTHQKLEDQEKVNEQLEYKYSETIRQHQTNIRSEKEKSSDKEQKLLKNLSDAKSQIIQLEFKISDLNSKNQSCQKDCYELKEKIAHLQSEKKIMEDNHHEILLAEKLQSNNKLNELEESYLKEDQLRKSLWEGIKNDLQKELQNKIEFCQELEKEILNLKSEKILIEKKAEDEIKLTRMKILSEKNHHQQKLEEKVLELESEKQNFKFVLEDMKNNLDKANQELSRKDVEKESEIFKMKSELQKRDKQLEMDQEKIMELKNQIFMTEQKMNEQSSHHHFLLNQKEKEYSELKEKLQTKEYQFNKLCEEISQRTHSLQAAVKKTQIQEYY